MPVRSHDVFADLLEKIDPSINPFVLQLAQAQESGELPVAFGPKLKDFPGNWRSKFTQVESSEFKPLIVEIGCHYGHTLIDMASANPETLFVGIDITFKRVINTAQRAKAAGLKNIFIILANAGGLSELFSPEEVTGFVTFFPDPWKKKKHAHNRLYSPKFCESAWRILSNNGFLWLKTDHKEYFDSATEHALISGFLPTNNISVLGETDYSSNFMRRFELFGQPWYGMKWAKIAPNSANLS
jgi:tRNA (guanine-N(7)-)-methyltransferase